MLDGYITLPNGVIKQEKIFSELMTYDEKYIQPYTNFGEMGVRMSYLRLANIISTLGYNPETLLDVGYGNGDFLNVCDDVGIDCWGTDISGYPTPNNVNFIRWEEVFNVKFEVITFFDALEHFEDISFVKDLKCEYVVISVPECHQHIKGDEWFKTWKHRKPDEHLWHFNRYSLDNFMLKCGYNKINDNNIEDIIRKPYSNELPNILTTIFKKK